MSACEGTGSDGAFIDDDDDPLRAARAIVYWAGGAPEFGEVTQRKHAQLNDTVGVLVPVRTLQLELPRGAMRETSVRQLELLDTVS